MRRSLTLLVVVALGLGSAANAKDTDKAAKMKMLEARRSCALLTRSEMELGKVPTTPTTASSVITSRFVATPRK